MYNEAKSVFKYQCPILMNYPENKIYPILSVQKTFNFLLYFHTGLPIRHSSTGLPQLLSFFTSGCLDVLSMHCMCSTLCQNLSIHSFAYRLTNLISSSHYFVAHSIISRKTFKFVYNALALLVGKSFSHEK